MSIYLAIGFILTLAVVLAIIMSRWATYRSRGAALCVALAAIAWLFVHPLLVANCLIAARILPVADVIIWSNPQPLCVGAFTGIAWTQLGTPKWQRWALLVPLCAFCIYRTVEPVVGSPAQLRGHTMTGEVVRQSSKSSCSAAACATALRLVGIETDEAEMAGLCLTKARGTFRLGIYRGLKLKTDGTQWKVEVFTGSLDEFLKLPPAPAVANITVAGDRRALLGASHSVMIFPSSGSDRIEIGDPFVGKYSMTKQSLGDVWQNEALRLVRRE